MVENIVKVLEKSEGRDKILKSVQYFSVFVKGISSGELAARLMSLSSSIRHSRQIFRLFRSIFEISSIQKSFKKHYSDNFTRVLEILTSASLCARWFFDNLSVLSSYKVLKLDHHEMTKVATTSWMIGLIFSICNCSREMMKSYAKEAMIKENSVGKTTKWVIDNLDDLSNTRRIMILEIAKNIGDLVIASNGALVPYKLLGKQFSEKWVGIGGFVSAIISLHEIWKDL